MTTPLQPLLHDELIVLRAPTQVWSAAGGTIGAAPIHGIAHSDVRVVRALHWSIGGHQPEHLQTDEVGADRARIPGLLRHLDDPTPDPGVRVVLERTGDAAGIAETLTVTTRHDEPLDTIVELQLDPDATLIDQLKQGLPPTPRIPVAVDGSRARWEGEHVTATLRSSGLAVSEDAG